MTVSLRRAIEVAVADERTREGVVQATLAAQTRWFREMALSCGDTDDALAYAVASKVTNDAIQPTSLGVRNGRPR